MSKIDPNVVRNLIGLKNIIETAKKNAANATYNEDRVVRRVLSKIPKVRDGRHGRDGKDAVIDQNLLMYLLKNLPEEKGLSVKHVQGLEQTLRSMWNQIGNNKGNGGKPYLHGGGDTVKAGTGISITHNPDGTTTIASTVTGLAILPATGTVNDANVTFTFTQLPTLICINGGMYQPTGGAITWSWSAGTLTATLSSPVGTGGSIFGVV